MALLSFYILLNAPEPDRNAPVMRSWHERDGEGLGHSELTDQEKATAFTCLKKSVLSQIDGVTSRNRLSCETGEMVCREG